MADIFLFVKNNNNVAYYGFYFAQNVNSLGLWPLLQSSRFSSCPPPY